MQSEESALLQTIQIPKNLLVLSDKLPIANYGKLICNSKLTLRSSLSYSTELPDIRSKASHIKEEGDSIKKEEKYIFHSEEANRENTHASDKRREKETEEEFEKEKDSKDIKQKNIKKNYIGMSLNSKLKTSQINICKATNEGDTAVNLEVLLYYIDIVVKSFI